MRIACLLAVGVLLLHPVSLRSQATRLGQPNLPEQTLAEYDTEQCVLAGVQGINDCLFARDPVTNAAFSAEATTSWQPPSSSGSQEIRATARYYRDAAGRVRVEQYFVGHEGGPHRVMIVPEPGMRGGFLLDDAAKRAGRTSTGAFQSMVGGGGMNRFVLPLSKILFISFFRLPNANGRAHATIDQEPLGDRTIAGVRTIGVRLTATLPIGLRDRSVDMSEERWVSPELRLVIANRSDDSELGVITYQLARINRIEPNPALFQVPPGYETFDEEFREVRTFHNPRVLLLEGRLKNLPAASLP